MIILGINAYHPDASVALVKDGVLLWAAEEERYNRIKHSSGFPALALKRCLAETGVPATAIDVVAISKNPHANFLKKISFALQYKPDKAMLFDRFRAFRKVSHYEKEFYEVVHATPGFLRAKFVYVEHHEAHAASAFFCSGFERAAFLSLDGMGDFSSAMWGMGEGNQLHSQGRVYFPHSAGFLYTAATQYLGFPHFGDEFKVMGLAAYGKPKFLEKFRRMYKLKHHGRFELNLTYFLHHLGSAKIRWQGGAPEQDQMYSPKWSERLEHPRRPEDPLTHLDEDIAASLQAAFEEIAFHVLKHLAKISGEKNLCLAGGCAYNSVANGKITKQTPFEKVYIQPAAGDSGTALGAALFVSHAVRREPRKFVMNHAYYGSEFSGEEIEKAIHSKGQILHSANFHNNSTSSSPQEVRRGSTNDDSRLKACGNEEVYEKLSENEVIKRTVTALTEGKIVGWFQGKMEFGPRSLGTRSILADPRRAAMKDILNKRIKRRESFRPFAPAVPEERAKEFFEMDCDSSPFMLKVFPVKPEKREALPAITHVDGTARVQTVSKAIFPLFWKLLTAFGEASGVPVLLNTSFNENEPIVCTPTEAIDCFVKTKMDVLVMGEYWLEKN